MNALQVFRYNETSIEFEVIVGELYANATAMCQANKKRVNDWKNLSATTRYVSALEAKPGITVPLIISRLGGLGGGSTTWIHEKLILKLAAWLDVQFEIWCDERIGELMRTGQVATGLPLTQDEIILMLAQRNVETQKRLSVVESKVDQLLHIQSEARSELLLLPLPTVPVAEVSKSDQIRRMINRYSVATSTMQPENWRKLYEGLYYRYKIGVNSLKKKAGESTLQVLIRNGHLDKLYDLALHEFGQGTVA